MGDDDKLAAANVLCFAVIVSFVFATAWIAACGALYAVCIALVGASWD